MAEMKTIPGFSNYKITKDGKVTGFNIGWKGNIYMSDYEASGYKVIRLKADDGTKRKCCLIHRIVYLAWGGPIPKGYWINHKDGNKFNNHISNLECGTPQSNHIHARDVLKRKYARGQKSGHAMLLDEEREAVKTLAAGGWSQHRISRLFHISQSAVHLIVHTVPVNT